MIQRWRKAIVFAHERDWIAAGDGQICLLGAKPPKKRAWYVRRLWIVIDREFNG
jgi:hypothetical protein